MALVVLPVRYPAVLNGQQNGKLPLTILFSTPGLGGGPTVWFVSPASRAWRALSGSAPMVLQATSVADSYRSYQRQVQTFTDRYQLEPIAGRPFRLWDSDNSGTPEKWYQKPDTAVAAVPGTSNHGWGLAIDIASAFGDRLAWLEANAVRFGWSWETVPSEPWHIRYVSGDVIPPAVLAFEEDQLSTANEYNADAHGWALSQLLPSYKVWPGPTPPEATFTATNQLAALLARMDQKLNSIEAKVDALEQGSGVTIEEVRDEIAGSTITPSTG